VDHFPAVIQDSLQKTVAVLSGISVWDESHQSSNILNNGREQSSQRYFAALFNADWDIIFHFVSSVSRNCSISFV
jgi:hypothetical protein